MTGPVEKTRHGRAAEHPPGAPVPSGFRFTSPPPWAIASALAVLWLAVLAWQRYGPWDANVQPFNADDGIPILMSNSDRLSPFHLYFLGQDRFGSWPFLLMQAVHRVTGYWWTAGSHHAAGIAFLLLGLAPLAALLPRYGLVLASGYLLTLCLNQEMASEVFRIGQPYHWQIPVLFLAWLCVRLAFKALLRARRRWIFRAVGGFALLSLLAVWLSPLSIPLLALVLAVESAGAAVRRPAKFGSSLVQLTAVLLSSLLVTALAERIIHRWHATFTLASYGAINETVTDLDFTGLVANAGTVWEAARQWTWWPAAPLAAVFGIASLALLGRCLWGSFSGSPGGQPWNQAAAACLVFAGWGWANFAVVLVSVHVAMNGFHPRHLVLSHFSWAMAAVCGVIWAGDAMMRRLPIARAVSGYFAATILILVIFVFPASGGPNDYVRVSAAARDLAARWPDGLILGGYWGTVVFAALAPRNELVPAVRDGEFNPEPWTIGQLDDHDRILLSPYLTAPFGDGIPVVVYQHGRVFGLAGPVEKFAGYTFIPYRNLLRASRPLTILPAPDYLDLCDDAMDVTIEVEPTRALTLLLRSDVTPYERPPLVVASQAGESVAGQVGDVTVRNAQSGGFTVVTVERSNAPFSRLRLTLRQSGRVALPNHPADVCPLAQSVAVPFALFH